MRRRPARAALLGAVAVSLAVSLAGCGGDGAATAPAPRPVDAQVAQGVPAPGPARALMRLVSAAGRGDADAMWGMLTRATRASIGPTLPEFRAGAAEELTDSVGTLAGRARVILSRRVGRYGVAAVAGRRVPEDGGEEEEYAYAAALVVEDRRWRVELAGAVVGSLRPGSLEKVDDDRPELRAEVDAASRVRWTAMWLDGEAVDPALSADGPFSVRLEAEPPRPLARGFHRVVVFAGTSDTAVALAWPFEVE